LLQQKIKNLQNPGEGKDEKEQALIARRPPSKCWILLPLPPSAAQTDLLVALPPAPLGLSRRETPGGATSSELHDEEKECAAVVFLQDVGPPPPPPPQVASVS
jgi:hypothetical protein